MVSPHDDHASDRPEAAVNSQEGGKVELLDLADAENPATEEGEIDSAGSEDAEPNLGPDPRLDQDYLNRETEGLDLEVLDAALEHLGPEPYLNWDWEETLNIGLRAAFALYLVLRRDGELALARTLEHPSFASRQRAPRMNNVALIATLRIIQPQKERVLRRCYRYADTLIWAAKKEISVADFGKRVEDAGIAACTEYVRAVKATGKRRTKKADKPADARPVVSEPEQGEPAEAGGVTASDGAASPETAPSDGAERPSEADLPGGLEGVDNAATDQPPANGKQFQVTLNTTPMFILGVPYELTAPERRAANRLIESFSGRFEATRFIDVSSLVAVLRSLADTLEAESFAESDRRSWMGSE